MINDPAGEDWRVFDHAEAVAEHAVELISACAREAIAQKGAFHFVSAGGTTPNLCYQRLRATDQDWSRWFVYMGDERVLAAEDAERNSVALQTHWLDYCSVPEDQIYFMVTEQGLEQAADSYQTLLNQVGCFDLVLLGMGEDGHTASLFPGHESLTARSDLIQETQSPKPPSQRLSLSLPRLNNSHTMLKLITGAGKADAVQRWKQGEALPISLCRAQQQTFTFLDQAAMNTRA